MRPLLRRPDELLSRPVLPASKLHPGAAVAIGLFALAFQIFLPRYIPLAALLDLPLLAVVYLALPRRHPLAGMFAGAAIGLAQDSLTHGPIGLFGIVNSIVGFVAASASQYIEVGFPGARGALAALFYLLHQALYWTLSVGLLAGQAAVEPIRALMLGVVHAGLALVLFGALDRLRGQA